MEYNANPTNRNSPREDKGRHTVRIILAVIVIICLIVFGWILSDGLLSPEPSPTVDSGLNTISDQDSQHKEPAVSTELVPVATEAVKVMVTGLKVPWDIAFLPDGSMLVTERIGNLVVIKKDGTKSSIKLPRPVPKGEGGLLGITLHPDFAQNKFLYLYMTTQSSTVGTKNAVFRYVYENGELKDEKVIILNIPGAIYHDGGRIEFGPDRLLYITTGDAQDSSIAQDLKSLGGKILRVTDEGVIPSDNPFDTAVYSYGHRNPQGLAWDSAGQLWATEHGRSGITSGMDEINLIEKGGNYGWPTIEGDKTKVGMKTPILHSGAKTTWAPASALFIENSAGKSGGGSLFFGGLLGESLYEAVLEDGRVKELKSRFHEAYGRIRALRLGPDGMLYFTTSNRDGRGDPIKEDDRVVRVDLKQIQ